MADKKDNDDKRGGSNQLFDRLATGRADPEARSRRRASGFLAQRENRLAELTRADVESKVRRWVDPAICRMWKHHDRFYHLLDQARCQDLIDQFLSQGRQEIPAIVRKVDGDPDIEYEVICGARRHWTVSWLRANNYPEFQFLIEVRDLTDEQAFRVSDVENRGHEDLSDYERALKYKNAIGTIYKSQAELADRNRRSTSWVSRYLDLAELPEPVIRAYPSVLEIRVSHARELKGLLKGAAGKQLLERAAEIEQEQAERRTQGLAPLDGQAVLSALKKAAVQNRAKRGGQSRIVKIEPIKKDDQVVLSGNFNPRSGWTLKIPANAGNDPDSVLEAVRRALEMAGQ